MFCPSDPLCPPKVRSNITSQEDGGTLPFPQAPIDHLWPFLWPYGPSFTVPGICVDTVLGKTFLADSIPSSTQHSIFIHGTYLVHLRGLITGVRSLLPTCSWTLSNDHLMVTLNLMEGAFHFLVQHWG